MSQQFQARNDMEVKALRDMRQAEDWLISLQAAYAQVPGNTPDDAAGAEMVEWIDAYTIQVDQLAVEVGRLLDRLTETVMILVCGE